MFDSLTNLFKSLCTLSKGRYMIILTIGNKADYSIMPLGDVHFLGKVEP